MDKKPQKNSLWWQLLITILLGIVGQVVLPLFLPPIVGFIVLAILTVAVVIKGISVLWKVFHPDDPADLSLK